MEISDFGGFGRRSIGVAIAALISIGCPKPSAAPDAGSPSASALLDVPSDQVFVASDSLRVIDVALGQAIWGLELPAPALDLAFDAPGAQLFVATARGVFVVDLEARSLSGPVGAPPAGLNRMVPSRRARRRIASKDEQKIYSMSFEPSSTLFENDRARTATRSFTLEPGDPIDDFALTRDESTLVVCRGSTATLLELGTGQSKASIDLGGPHFGVAISGDGRRAYFVGEGDEEAGVLTILRLDPLKIQGRIHIDGVHPRRIAVRPPSAHARRSIHRDQTEGRDLYEADLLIGAQRSAVVFVHMKRHARTSIEE